MAAGSCTNREVISETDQAKSDADLRKSGEEVVVMAHKGIVECKL